MIKLIVILLVICMIMYNYKNCNYEDFKTTPPDAVTRLYKMLHIVNMLFEKNNIPYWMDGGTVLGAVRHNGIIPWDDDADIQVMKKYYQNILDMESEFNSHNLILMKTWFGFKVFFKDGKNIDGYEWKYPFVDIFIMEEKNGIIQYESSTARANWSNCYYEADDINNLQDYNFGNFYLKGVNERATKQYLDRCYGDDWQTHAYEQYDHENERPIEQIKVELTQEDREPARPFYSVEPH